MSRLLYLSGLLLMFFHGKAHQPDVSTTMLTELKNGAWVVQVNSSLTAFQQEVRISYPNDTYKTPEEFQKMAIEHVRCNLLVVFNGKDTLRLKQGHVKLGHETNLVFETSGVPENFTSLTVTNSSFKDINRNQSALVILKNGIAKKHFVLDATNAHTANLKLNGDKLTEIKQQKNDLTPFRVFPVLAGIIIVLGGVTLWKANSKEETT